MSNILKKYGAWLLTEKGQQFCLGVASAATIGIGCCFYVPHTFLLDYYRDFMHYYRHGYKIPVTPILRERFKKTLDLLEMPEYDRKQYKPFMVNRFDIFSAGSYFSRYGVIIGMPITFTHLDVGYVDTHQMIICDQSVAWDMPEGKLLYRSLLVPEKAQLYAIAREIQMRQTGKFFLDCLNPVAASVMAYFLGTQLNSKYNLLSKPRALRFSIYALLGGFFITLHLAVKDFLQVYYEEKIDDYLVKKDPIFQEGGKIHYQLLIQRNMGLRDLMGKLGKHNFTADGNENYTIRQRHLPIVQRKEFFENYVNQS